MEKKKVTMLVISEITKDPRVLKSAIVTADNNYKVTVICVPNKPHLEKDNSKMTIIRINQKEFLKKIKKYRNKRNEKPNLKLIESKVEKKQSRIITTKEFLKFGIITFINIEIFIKGLSIKTDIYHANDLNTLPAGFFLAKLKRAKLVYDSHELYVEQYSNTSTLYKKLLSFIEKIYIRKADAVITVNDSIAEILSERYKIPMPMTMMNCPVYQPAPKKSLRNDIKKIIYLGRYTEDRGIEELILSMKNVKSAKLYLRGFGPHENYLRALATNNDLTEKVIFLEPVDMTKMVDSLEGFDIGIVPYKPVSLNNKLASPNKIFEYMMAGLPIAASDSPELKKIVTKNKVGVLFDPSNPKDIANKINKLIENDKLLEEMKENALRCAKSEYNWEVQSRKLISVYDSLIKNNFFYLPAHY
jgi:glycosyltransferase involved in cell wall biosynthesis